MFICLKYCSGRQSPTASLWLDCFIRSVLSSPQEELKLLGARWDLTPTRHTGEARGSRPPADWWASSAEGSCWGSPNTWLIILSTRQEMVRLPFLVAKAEGNVAAGAYWVATTREVLVESIHHVFVPPLLPSVYRREHGWQGASSRSWACWLLDQPLGDKRGSQEDRDHFPAGPLPPLALLHLPTSPCTVPKGADTLQGDRQSWRVGLSWLRASCCGGFGLKS